MRHKESRRTYRIMTAEVIFGGVKARLSVLCAYDFLNYSGRTKTLGRMGSRRRKQRNYLFHRTEDGAMGLHSRQLVLHRALCGQRQGMAKGGAFLTAKIIGETLRFRRANLAASRLRAA